MSAATLPGPVVGVGVDLVEIAGFADQLEVPGSRWSRSFTVREWRDADDSPAGRPASLAARWAAKEAFVKAWSGALYGRAPVLTEHRWADIEVRIDRWRRPCLVLHGVVAEGLVRSIGDVEIQVSLSHDGGFATAYVVLTGSGTTN